MKNDPKIIERTWDDVVLSVAHAASKMKEDGKLPNGVYGIPRGGVCIAVLFSHLLKIEYLAEPREGCLICDDIADTGNTLLRYKDLPGITFYTDVSKEMARAKPDYCGLAIPGNDPRANAWFEFPWEGPAK